MSQLFKLDFTKELCNYNNIGDSAGHVETVKALQAKMPQDAVTCLHGDLNDRGPYSRQLIEYAMEQQKLGRMVITNSNHGHMFYDYYMMKTVPGYKPYYEDSSVFLGNGGDATLLSYGMTNYNQNIADFVPKEHIEWLKNLPLSIVTEKFMFSHAPLIANKTIEQASNLGKNWHGKDYYKAESSLIWNRLVPWKAHDDLKGRINIFGHNPSDEVKIYSPRFQQGLKVRDTAELREQMLDTDPDNQVFAIAIDTCRARILTGIHLPTWTMYKQPYIDFKESGMY